MRAIKSFKWMLFSIPIYDRYPDRFTVRGGLATNACASAKIELCAGRRRGKFFRCPQADERGKAWSDETTGEFAGRTL